jgi:hypothetical protein
LITGTDLVTGEPVNRWMEALGVFAGAAPGGKAALKGVMLGATVLKKADKANDAARAVKRANKVKGTKPLLPGEGSVGTYGELVKKGSKGDNLTPHHMPADSFMKKHGVKRKDGVAMDMEQPSPGTGGRHRRTRTYGRKADINETPREALARDIKDSRKIYKEDGVYTPEINKSHQEVIQKNKELYPELFKK